MSDIHSTLPSKIDLITGVAATTGLPAPVLAWTSILDETAKVAAIIYSVVSATWIIIQILRSRKK